MPAQTIATLEKPSGVAARAEAHPAQSRVIHNQEMNMNNDNHKLDANRDPLTGAPGAHPVGTGIGAVVGGAAAGAATGTVAGPVGTVVGAAIGAIVGGLAGKGVAEEVNPTRERAYWSENFSGRDYVEKGSSFDDYGPAYDFGVNARGRYPGRAFDDVDSEMSGDWGTRRGASSLSWERAQYAARDAWNRITPSS
jgi:hypothetical protein